MILESFIRKVKRKRPKNIHQFDQIAGMTAEKVNEGCSKFVYAYPGWPIVIKIPSDEGSVLHSRQDMLGLRRLQRDVYKEFFEPYLPKVYYFDRKTGIMIQEKYKTVTYQNIGKKNQREGEVLENLIAVIFGQCPGCVEYGGAQNIGFDSTGHMKLLDLGLYGWDSSECEEEEMVS